MYLLENQITGDKKTTAAFLMMFIHVYGKGCDCSACDVTFDKIE